MSALGPYSRDRQVDKPGIAGARWWHDALVDQQAQVLRRDAIRSILIAGGLIAGFGALLTMCVKSAISDSTPSGSLTSDYSEARHASLEMQRAYGWSFGAVGEPLVFDGVTTKPFEPGALASLTTDLWPLSPYARPYAQSTLFESPDALPSQPSALDPDESAGFTKLSTSLKPSHTPAMDVAYAKGKALAGIFESLAEEKLLATAAKALLVVDLAGPLAVAFAAGAAEIFDPIFLFDNWPHPRGVVRAHETLSAAAYYQPRFATTRNNAPAGRPSMFVLDRNRLAPYQDDKTQFDNRWIAKLPRLSVEINQLGANHVLYICPEGTTAPFELADLNEELVSYVRGGVDVRALSLELLAQETAQSDGAYYYGGSKASHYAFFVDYPWAKPPHAATAHPAVNLGKSYVPVARASTSSFKPATFATVPVVIAVATGVIVGARYSRNGSWNRASSGWGGG